MPTLPLPFCTYPGCSARVKGRCAKHRRPSAHKQGYTKDWSAYSKTRLQQYPWCVGYPTGIHGEAQIPASVTDHIKSARRYPWLFWRASNHQSLCGSCNRRKAVAEEGGFGR